jgi:hypothetical protein
MVKLKCANIGCGRVWEFKGKDQRPACPTCHTARKIEVLKVKEETPLPVEVLPELKEGGQDGNNNTV